MAEHKHGTMNIEPQEKTFNGFITATKVVVGIVFVVLLIMAVFNS
ncbi:aa3-type cytochrome c oxidase subunit IV [Pseudooceanicola sp. 502str34]|nr:aa3-type cytochrome c oxidase subunit IV [Maritimibacter alkaliphilus]MBY6092427.1 aa3-type cytochrome c oxidase subunit IV [Maritimibacter alkaliphilus]